jgi:hypothetical protein
MISKRVGKRTEIQDATTPTTTFQDEGFVRTALIVSNDADPSREGGSVDVVRIVNGKVERLAQINIFALSGSASDDEESFMVDVIDVDQRYTTRRALVFSPTERAHLDVPKGGNLVASHFSRKIRGGV